MHIHELPGLDGGNLLAYLAALGTLHVLSEAQSANASRPCVALSWRPEGGIWIPLVHHSTLATRQELLSELKRVCCRHEPTERREQWAEAQRRLKEFKCQPKTELKGLKAEAKAVAKEQHKARQAQLAHEEEDAKATWEKVNDHFEAQYKRCADLLDGSNEADDALAKAEREAKKALKGLAGKTRDTATAGWKVKIVALSSNAAAGRRAWLEALASVSPAPAFSLGKNLTATCTEFADFARRAAAASELEKREWADFAAAFGSEAFPTDKGLMQDTAFRTMSGTGHLHFLGSMAKLYQLTTVGDIERTLFSSWDYEDDGPAMRWDPADDRRYALRSDNPAKSKENPIRTMRGANRLAIEALALFPTAPAARRRLETTGFSKSAQDRVVAWPIWTEPLAIDIVRSVLALEELQQEKIDRATMRARGIGQVYRARRLNVGQYRNFSPSEERL